VGGGRTYFVFRWGGDVSCFSVGGGEEIYDALDGLFALLLILRRVCTICVTPS